MDGTRRRLALLLARGIAAADWERLPLLLGEGYEGPANDAELAAVSAVLERPAGPVDWREADRQVRAMERAGARVLLWWDAGYPAALRDTPGMPPALFVRGRADLLQELAVGVVGTRKPSPAGSAFAQHLSRDLSARGLAVVSGLARGIDTAAHRGALGARGSTVAVLGTGVDVVYPPENGALMERIAAEGTVVSEQMCGMQAFAHVFPKRNRIISGLAKAVVVVEGGAKSGALITARWALDQGREVGAVPGFPGDFRSAGPNQLLREGALVIESAEDVVRGVRSIALALDAGLVDGPGEAGAKPQLAGLDGDAARVYDLLARGAGVDEVALAAGIGAAQAQRVLAHLEIDGHVERDAAGRYHRARRGGRETVT
jgi:DNA processing protein